MGLLLACLGAAAGMLGAAAGVLGGCCWGAGVSAGVLGGLLLGCWAGYCWGAGGGRALDIGFGVFPRVFEGSKKCTKAMRNTMRICDLGVSAWKPLGGQSQQLEIADLGRDPRQNV